jgi:hypothetical protein
VPGLGHDDVDLTEVGNEGVAELVQPLPGEQDAGAVVVEADPSGFWAVVARRCGLGRRSDRNRGPHSRPAM